MIGSLLPERPATEPPEARGLERDEVRLLVASSRGIRHGRFRDLPAQLSPGDVLVVNVSATLPAAVDGHREDGRPVGVHFSGPVPDEEAAWIVELRRPDRTGPALDGRPGERVVLPGGATLTLRRAVSGPDGGTRLWDADVRAAGSVVEWLHRVGRPIRYGYVPEPWPLEAYQTLFAVRAGSAEMPSAARPFTARVLSGLIARGVLIAPVVLHTGVSSPEAGEPPRPERYEVPSTTVRTVEHARRHGARVVAVGTTSVRAIESAVDAGGQLAPSAGWTDLVLGPDRTARVVDGLLTGWHERGASHLELLRAVVGSELVARAYDAAAAHDYRWHEFGDSCLLLP